MKNRKMTEADLRELTKAGFYGYLKAQANAKEWKYRDLRRENNSGQVLFCGDFVVMIGVEHRPKDNFIHIQVPYSINMTFSHVKAIKKADELGLITLSLPETLKFEPALDKFLTPYVSQGELNTHFCPLCSTQQPKLDNNPFGWCMHCFAAPLVMKVLYFRASATDGYVFVARKQNDGQYALGISKDPEALLDADTGERYESLADTKLELVCKFPADNMGQCESAIMRAMEWRPKIAPLTDKDVAYLKTIERYRDGGFYFKPAKPDTEELSR